jgi:hypothetical protein
MCGGNPNAATNAANKQQADTQAAISNNISQINSAFGNRSQEYSDYQKALQTQYQTELNRQQGIATRNAKFANARNGVAGGSAAVDSSKLLGQEEAQGTVNAQQQVQSNVAKLQANDQATKQQMISLAESGADVGNAAQMTADQLRANVGNAQGINAAAGLGQVFGDTATSYNNEQNAAALRNGVLKSQMYTKSGLGG